MYGTCVKRHVLQALGAKLEALMSNGPEDWLELWRLEVRRSVKCLFRVKDLGFRI